MVFFETLIFEVAIKTSVSFCSKSGLWGFVFVGFSTTALFSFMVSDVFFTTTTFLLWSLSPYSSVIFSRTLVLCAALQPTSIKPVSIIVKNLFITPQYWIEVLVNLQYELSIFLNVVYNNPLKSNRIHQKIIWMYIQEPKLLNISQKN